MTVSVAILSIATCAGLVHTVLPPQCLANFRWDDCGKPPRTVIYYWRVGSRCEVGIWRGCLPNINMFRDEYECVSTCTFSVRAAAQDFHQLNEIEEDFTTPNIDTDVDNSTDENDVVDSTTSATDITTVDATDEGDEKNDENEKEEGTDDKKDENKKEKDGEKDTPDEEGKDSATESQAITEADNENAEEEAEEETEEETKEPDEAPE